MIMLFLPNIITLIVTKDSEVADGYQKPRDSC